MRLVVLNAKVVSITAGGALGNQSYAGVGFKPKAVIFLAIGLTTEDALSSLLSDWSLGFAADSSNQALINPTFRDYSTSFRVRGHREDSVFTDNSTVGRGVPPLVQVNLASMDTDGFTLNTTVTGGVSYPIYCLCLGGADILNAKLVSFDLQNFTGPQDIQVGFAPDFLLFLSGNMPSASLGNAINNSSYMVGMVARPSLQVVTAGMGVDQVATTQDKSYQDTGSCIALLDPVNVVVEGKAQFVQFLSAGFRLSVTVAPSTPRRVSCLAIKGGAHSVGFFNMATAVGNQVLKGLPFQPKGLFLQSAGNPSSTTLQPNASVGFGIGTDSNTRKAEWGISQDGNNLAVGGITGEERRSAKVFSLGNLVPAIGDEADLTSFDANGFTLNWLVNAGVARQLLYWIMADTQAASSIGGFLNPSSPYHSIGAYLESLN